MNKKNTFTGLLSVYLLLSIFIKIKTLGIKKIFWFSFEAQVSHVVNLKKTQSMKIIIKKFVSSCNNN